MKNKFETLSICQLCKCEKSLCDSHIIPEFMYRPLYTDRHRTIGLRASQRDKNLIPVQKGLRDPLLCTDCETHFNKHYEQPNVGLWRAFAENTVLEGLSAETFTAPDGTEAVRIRGFDYTSFKLLLLSILWRASVSKLGEFSQVNLGPHEDVMRRMLLEVNPGSQTDYPCLVYTFTEPNLGILIPPARGKTNGHTGYQFVITSALLWFFVSSHIEQEELMGFAPREDGSLVTPIIKASSLPLYLEATDRVREVGISKSMIDKMRI